MALKWEENLGTMRQLRPESGVRFSYKWCPLAGILSCGLFVAQGIHRVG